MTTGLDRNIPSPASAPTVTVLGSPGLCDWLQQAHLGLAFTTYQTNRLFLVGSTPEKLTVNERLFDKPMGLYALTEQRSKAIAAHLRPEVIEANLSRGATSLESLVRINFQGYIWTRTLARQIVQFSFGYTSCPLNLVFRSTEPQTPVWVLSVVGTSRRAGIDQLSFSEGRAKQPSLGIIDRQSVRLEEKGGGNWC